ncbi:MAG: 5-formyltetrahydrofolate cyclo-ligase [Aquificaceae bacterium]|nr:5-formyltetrahydrofolate cyclo-ligase [Aquificaceae bacterium]MDW8237513.1 5-formyltetrahydrofolate cyclo-ligase [Aquificaceae bacterium]
MVKEVIREGFLKRRLLMSQEERELRSWSIAKNLKGIISTIAPKTILGFSPIKKEPQLWPLFQELWKEGLNLWLPAIAKGGLLLFEFKGSLKKAPLGTLEPEGFIAKEPANVDLAIVPGVCFDLEGYRIGYGGGYYDRFLKLVKAIKVGVCFDEELIQSFERNSWDEKVDFIVTDKRVIGGLR